MFQHILHCTRYFHGVTADSGFSVTCYVLAELSGWRVVVLTSSNEVWSHPGHVTGCVSAWRCSLIDVWSAWWAVRHAPHGFHRSFQYRNPPCSQFGDLGNRSINFRFHVKVFFFFANFSPKQQQKMLIPVVRGSFFSPIAQDKYRYSAFVKRTEQPQRHSCWSILNKWEKVRAL